MWLDYTSRRSKKIDYIIESFGILASRRKKSGCDYSV